MKFDLKKRMHFMHIKKPYIIQLQLTILFLICSMSFFGQTTDTLKHHYKVGIRNNFEPLDFLNKDDKPAGLTAELLEEIAQSANVTFNLFPMSFNQTVNALDNDEVDIIPLIITPERRKKYIYTTPYCQISQALFQSTQNKEPVTVNSLKGHTIGFIEGDALLDTFATRTDFKKHIVLSKLDGFIHLRNGQIDAFFCGEQNGIKSIADNNFNDIKLVAGHLYPREYAFAAEKDHQQLIQLLDSQLSKLQASGKLKQLSDKWLTIKMVKPNWFKTHEVLLITLLIIFTLAIILLLLWNWLLRSKVEDKTRSIKESEEKYRDLIENSPDAIAIYVEGIIVMVNYECLRLMRAETMQELIGRNVLEFIHPDFRSFVIERMKNASLQNLALPLAEEKFIRNDGALVDVEVKAMPIKYENKPAIQLIIRDISERKRTEELLEKNRQEFIELFDNAPIGYHEIDSEGRIVRINQTECNMLGYKADELISQYIWILNSDEEFSKNSVLQKLNGTLIPPKSFERKFKRKDGTYVWVLVKDKVLKSNEGIITGIRTTIEDINEIIIAREKLDNEHLLLRTVIDNIPDAIYAKDLELKKTLANKADIHNIGVKMEAEVLGKTDFELFPEEFAKNFFKDDKLVLQDKKPILNREEYLIDDKGEIRWLLTSKLPLFDKDNKLIGLVGIGRDITEQKNAHETLENERLLLRTVIDNIPDPIYAKDLEGRKTLANNAEVKILGANSESEVLGKDDFAFYPNEVAQKFKIREQVLLQTGDADLNTEDYRIDDKGKVIWLLSSKIPLRDKSGHLLGIVGIGRNITTRKEIEESLRESEELYRNLVEMMPDGVYKSTHDGKFVSVNEAMVKLLGYDSKEELLKIDIKSQLYFDPSDRESLVLEQELQENGVFKMKKKDGSEVWVEDHGWYNTDQNNNILFHEGVMRDITDRIQAEIALNKSREELKNFAAHLQNVREEERLMLANEIHDELGQILIAIKIDMGILKQKTLKVIDPDKSKDIIPKFENLFGMINNTINATRKIMTDNRHEVLHLMGFIESAKLQISNFQEKYPINCRFENEIDKLDLNPQQSIALFRILQESLSNVAKHSKATEVTVSLVVKDNILRLEIKDNGVGFVENHEINKEAFGFISMNERVYLLDGELIIHSEPGKGTSIKVEMPYIVLDKIQTENIDK